MDSAAAKPSVDEIYHELHHGRGREHVTDANVEELIQLAKTHGDTTNEFLLREWRSTCGDDPQAPDLRKDFPKNPPYVHREF